MAVTINADTSNGVIITPDTSGEIKLQSAGTDIATVNSSGITMASGKAVSGGEIIQNAGPAFSAYASSTTTCSNGTFTKVNYNTEYFDIGSCYDSSNSRFTPNVAGYYQINANTFINDTMGSNTLIAIGKNGSEWQRGSGGITSTPLYYTASALIYCNGTTDYIEVFQYQSSGTTKNLWTGGVAQFNGYLARAV